MTKSDDPNGHQAGSEPGSHGELLSISEAYRRGYAGRATIHRALKEGRLSGELVADGTRRVLASDLHRLFGDPVSRQPARRPARASAPADALQAELVVLRQQRDQLRSDFDRERQRSADREEWLRGEIEELRRLLEKLISIAPSSGKG